MSSNLKRAAAAAIFCTILSTAALAHHLHDGAGNGQAADGTSANDAVDVGDITIAHGSVKGMLPGQEVAGGYVTIENNGKVDDRLVKVTASVSPDVQIHEMTMNGEVMKMRQLKDGLPIKAGETVELQPGGFHLMFTGVKPPLREGQAVKATFTFEKAGSVEVTLPVIDPKKMKGGHKHG